MGISATLYTLTEANVAKLSDNPAYLSHVMQAADRLDGVELAPADDFTLADGEVTHVDIDKAWHGIHYLLNQTVWEGDFPLAFLANGGQQIDEEARVFTAADVAAIDIALAPFDAAALTARFNPQHMDELGIYPQIWGAEGQEALDYCLHYFDILKDFIHKAAARELGLVLFLG